MKLNNLISKNKAIIISIFVFGIVFLSLCIPFFKWGFYWDDFGNIFHSIQIKSFKDFLRFFYEGSVCNFLQPSNYSPPDSNFFTVFYRPLIFVFYYFQYLVFGIKPYAFFVCTIFLHALNATLLFNVLLYAINNYLYSFLGALFFAFHPVIYEWLGWAATQQYNLEVLFLILFFICFQKFLNFKLWRFFWCACFILLLGLLTRESLIVLPVIATLYVWFFNEKSFLDKKIWVFISGLWLVAFIYLGFRFCIFPLNIGNSSFGLFHFLLLKAKYSVVYSAYILPGLFIFFRDNIFLRYFLILLFYVFLLFLFWNNSKRKEIIFLGVSVFLVSWPQIIIGPLSRYVYLQIPFFVFLVMFCICFYNHKNRMVSIFLTKILPLFVFVFLFFSFIFLVSGMKKIEKQIVVINEAFDSLITDKKIQNKTLCFIGLPTYYFWNSVSQAIWLRGVNLSIPIYYDDSTWLIDGVQGEFLIIDPIKKGYRFISLNNEKMWFPIFPHPHRITLIMGKKIFNKFDKNIGRLYDFDLIFDQKYLDQNPVFISWDYKNKKFFILDPTLK